MKNLINLYLAVLLVFTISSCALPEEDPRSFVIITGNQFRTTGAINTDILWVGTKRRYGDHSFETKFLPVYKNEIATPKVTEAFSNETISFANEAATSAGIKIAIGGAGAEANKGSNTYRKSSGNYHVFKFFDTFKVVDELNSDENRENLENVMYNNARIVSSIAIVFDQEKHDKINKSSKIKLEVSGSRSGNADFLLKNEDNSEILAKVSDGTIFAYEISRFCWKKEGEIITIADIEVDHPGIDNDCPDGTRANPANLDED